MLIKAYAKINISLDVVGKREDGYHLLKMIMQQIELYDELNINKFHTKSDKYEERINITCNKHYIPCDERNLAFKAAKIFMEKYNVDGGVNIDLEKNIPVAAGLAGGSSDAAAVLKAMRKIFALDISDNELMELGVQIGADIPYCIKGGTALCEGIGEKVTKLKPFKNQIVVVVKPNFGVSTKEVYKAIDINKIYIHPETDRIIDAMIKYDLKGVCKGMKNNLENITLGKHKILKQIKEEMIEIGAVGSMMSGSGPSIFGFFDDMLCAQRCFEHFKEKYKEVFITRTI